MKYKTPYESYNLNGLPEGCKYCVKGEKLVLFISGICSRDCYYCSLSEKRKSKDIVLANERICKSPKDAILESIESNATSAGITGGDPLLFLDRTIKYAKELKQKFGKKYHIHIYLPTKLVTVERIKRLSKYVDEIRFNPEYSLIQTKEVMEKDLEKIKLARKFYKKENLGIELPMIPDLKYEFLELITKSSDIVGFVNLNEFELSETNMNKVTKKYKLNEGGYTIKDSIKSGIWIINEIEKRKLNVKVHVCTAKLKNNSQFINRLKRHNILPFGYKTDEGMVKYLVTDIKNKKYLKNKNEYFIDKQKNRINLSEKLAKKLLTIYRMEAGELRAGGRGEQKSKIKIFLVEEFPTEDRIETEKEEIN